MLRAVPILFALAPLLPAQQPAAAPCDLIHSVGERRDGQQALANKDYAAAAQAFQQAFAACPSQHSVLLELSEANLRQREWPAAIRAAQQFVDLEPGSVPGRLTLANAYFMSQRLPEALEQTKIVLQKDPSQDVALKLKGNIEYLGGQLDNALDTFILLLDRHPGDDEAAYMLGRIYYQEKRIDYAIGQFQRALKINPQSYKAYDNLGLCYQALGDTEMATRYFLTAIKLVEKDHPEYDWAYANLSSLLFDKGDFYKAYAAASMAAHRNPYSARNFYFGGKALAKLGKNELCVNWLERSVALDPKYPEPLYLLARVYSQMGQPDKAKAALEKFQELKATTPRERK
jgi:tetratricopeptide (TPR) repeat protein